MAGAFENHSLPTNPAELARTYIDSKQISNEFTSTENEKKLLVELDELSYASYMHGTYFTQTHKALAIPASFDSEKEVKYINFEQLSFEGLLETYSVVKIVKIIGSTTIRALCLTFSNVLTLPYFENISEEYLLHVPALAVDSMFLTELDGDKYN